MPQWVWFSGQTRDARLFLQNLPCGELGGSRLPESTGVVRPAGAAEDTALSILVARRGPTKRPPCAAVAFGLSEPQGKGRIAALAAWARDRIPEGGEPRPRPTMSRSPGRGSLARRGRAAGRQAVGAGRSGVRGSGRTEGTTRARSRLVRDDLKSVAIGTIVCDRRAVFDIYFEFGEFNCSKSRRYIGIGMFRRRNQIGRLRR